MRYNNPNSTRNSMDLIEGTTQHYPQGLKKPDTDAHIQRQRWDAFFEPQYSFGAFIHGLNQEEEEEYQKQQQQHQRKIDRLIDDGNYHIESSIKSPKYERQSCDFNSTNTETSTAAMTPTLPNLMESDKAWGPKDEKTLIDRLELLKKMRAQPISNTSTNDTDQEQDEASHAARWKRHISEKAKQLCKEAKDQDGSSSVGSPDPDEKQADEEQGGGGGTVKKYGCRRSFLCFVFGFLFPPAWLFGAFYFSGYANQQSSASRRIDRVWRKRSRIAFGIFTISLLIVLVVIFVLNPQSVGWRQSKQIGIYN
ncbi:hypothetical protein HPULCUR_007257 [Helicostylum pulchrum]|uniref:Uncharacterized protein n=1 Tax=Helicostylum pulchrum TaxID=562976 RepID=A0ABP9Y5F3_9FUNG